MIMTITIKMDMMSIDLLQGNQISYIGIWRGPSLASCELSIDHRQSQGV